MAMIQKLGLKILSYNSINNVIICSNILSKSNKLKFLFFRSFNNTTHTKLGVCDPYEQNKKPLVLQECSQYLKSLNNNWEILDFPKSDNEPPYTPKFHINSIAPISSCSSGGCSKPTCCQNTSTDTEKTVKPTTKQTRKFLGGLVLRREFRFRTIEMGQEFIEFINNVCINLDHLPYRCIADISRGYGHVMIELYTPFLKGLSYRDFSLALSIDTELENYKKRQSSSVSVQPTTVKLI